MQLARSNKTTKNKRDNSNSSKLVKNRCSLKNWDINHFDKLIHELDVILDDMIKMEASFTKELNEVNPCYRESARNFLHYLALRQHDIRELQSELASLGLSSLGRSELHVMSNIIAVMEVLKKLAGREAEADMPEAPVDLAKGVELLDIHTKGLFGNAPDKRNTYIMVTMPHQSASDYTMVKELVARGMDCVRINCANDDEKVWAKMIANVRRAEVELNKKCRIFMDLSGQKLRLGPIMSAPAVLRWSPKHDGFGKTIGPARIWLTPVEQKVPSASPVDACIPVPMKWLSGLKEGDQVEFKDTRDRQRTLEIVSVMGESRMAECMKSAYVTNGTIFVHKPADKNARSSEEIELANLPSKEQFITVAKGDTLILTKDTSPGKAPVCDDKGQLLMPAMVGVTMPEIFSDVKRGDRIWFDDGKIGGIIRFVNGEQVHVEITQARYGGEKLKANKGINLPDSKLRLPSLTSKDVEDLKFVAANADGVGFSFVNTESDVHELQSILKSMGGENLCIVLKIETLKAFEHLPGLLLAAMRSPCAGVMIARGDLAVESGYERMAEIQEEMLWLCEAAHMPVIWATQVLEKLAKKGLPSRAEITDAAMSERAECVMLNKGPYIVDAVLVLDDILKRMQGHQSKKVSLLRELKLARKFNA